MSILDQLARIIAPSNCIMCGKEDALLCSECAKSIKPYGSRCFNCAKITNNSSVCKSCYSQFGLRRVYVASHYDDVAKQLVRAYKFGHQRDGSVAISDLIIPALDFDSVIVPMPTIAKHVRQRGFDHTCLLAKKIAQAKKCQFLPILRRKDSLSQIGAKRQIRTKQLSGKFWVANSAKVAGKKIVLIDDVVTTGASLREAARVLRSAGAKTVDALVFAKRL